MFIGIAVIVIIVVLIGAAVEFLRPKVKRRVEQVRPTAFSSSTTRSKAYEWDRRTDKAYRKFKQVPGPDEDRARMSAFLDEHEGVEAYVEPRTVVHPLSVVLVDGEGRSKRFELREDTILRELARDRGIPVLDASKVGYPPRMRRGQSSPPSSPDS